MGLGVEAPSLAERVVDQGLRDAVVDDDEEADVLERAPELGRRVGECPRPLREEWTQIDHRDHDDEIAPLDAFDNEPGGSYGPAHGR